MNEHGSKHDDAGAYVVAALAPEDLAAYERHLAGCGRCQADVARLRETATELGWLAAAPPPPPGLRAALLASIPSVAQLPPEPSVGAGAGVRTATGSAAGTVPADLAAARQARASRRTRVLAVLVAAVSVVALALGGVVVSLAGRQPTPSAATAADPGLLSAPDARIVGATLPDGTHASFVVSRVQNRAMFVAHALPDPGRGRTYQLWTVRGGAATPDGTLAGGTDVAQWFHGTVADADQLAVTVEPAGGSRTPTSPVLASAAL